MNRTFAIFFIILAFGISGFAQNDIQVVKWQILSLPDEGFSINVPEGFKYSKLDREKDPITSRGEFQNNSETFYLFVDTVKTAGQYKIIQSFVRESKQTFMGIDLAGHEAAKAEFKDGDGYYHRMLVIRSGTRIFTLQTTTRNSNSTAAAEFLNSFRFSSQAAGIQPQAKTTIFAINPRGEGNKDPDAEELVDPAPSKEQARWESNSGTRQVPTTSPGSKTNVADTKASSLDNPPDAKAPLRILSKKKARYTKFARFYNIQGTVILHVEFLATGEIGPVSVVKSLPFGLTRESILAAQSIRFKPEAINGKPENASRPVIFSFSIY